MSIASLEATPAAPRTMEELRNRIDIVSGTLPKRLRQCADYVQGNLSRVAISTVAELADAAGVQPSALIRFCQAIGFSGFSEMQAVCRNEFARPWPDYSQRLDELRKKGDASVPALFAEFVSAGQKSLVELTRNADTEALERAVDTISGASMVHLVGAGRAYPVASYLGYIFEKMNKPCLLHGGIGRLEHRSAIRPGNALIAITFFPFSPSTIELTRHTATKALPIICMTDSADCPLAEIAKEMLIVREVDVGTFRALTASLVLATTLAVAVGARHN